MENETPNIKTIDELDEGEPCHMPVLKTPASSLSSSFYDNLIKYNNQSSNEHLHFDSLSPNKYDPLTKVDKLILPTIAGILLYGSLANAITTFSGKAWRHLYATPADSAEITITHPNGIDTAMTKVGRLGPAYWLRSKWDLNIGQVVTIKCKDTDGDSAIVTREVTNASGGNRVVDMYPAGHSLLVKSVWDSVDSADVKCYVKGKADTLTDRMDIGTSFWDVSFNAINFPIASRPAFGDSVFFLISSPGYQTKKTGLRYMNQFVDADTAPSCSLLLVAVEEKSLESKLKEKLIISSNPTNGLIKLARHFDGFLYDATGRLVSKIDSDKLDIRNYANGAYILTDDKKKPKTNIVLVK